MEKEDPCRPFLVLGDIVQDLAYIDHTGFQIVECRRREAYGCGPNGDAIVRGLNLFVRLGRGREDDPYQNPKLCVSASHDVLERVGSEIDDDKAWLYGRRLRLTCRIYAVDGDVMVLRVSFLASFSRTDDFRSYYLVYDSAAASLVLLSRRPICTTTTTPLILKVGDDKKYSLVLMAEEAVSSEQERSTRPALCLWSPPPSLDDSKRAWELKAGRVAVVIPAIVDPFKANVVFLCKGNAVWADLVQGSIMYCDCSNLIESSTEPPVVDFKHVMLPVECRWTEEEEDTGLLGHCSWRVYRTMGRAGDSIWFVVIQPDFTCPGETLVKVWTLSEDWTWKLHRELKMLEVFMAQGGHLPETVPKYPIVREQQVGCALYLLLPEPPTGGHAYGHLVCIDLSSSSSSYGCEVRLQSSRRLAIPLMDHPIVLDQDFFSHHHLEQIDLSSKQL